MEKWGSWDEWTHKTPSPPGIYRVLTTSVHSLRNSLALLLIQKEIDLCLYHVRVIPILHPGISAPLLYGGHNPAILLYFVRQDLIFYSYCIETVGYLASWWVMTLSYTVGAQFANIVDYVVYFWLSLSLWFRFTSRHTICHYHVTI